MIMRKVSLVIFLIVLLFSCASNDSLQFSLLRNTLVPDMVLADLMRYNWRIIYVDKSLVVARKEMLIEGRIISFHAVLLFTKEQVIINVIPKEKGYSQQRKKLAIEIIYILNRVNFKFTTIY